MIAQVRECGARVTLITDGDIAGVIHTTIPRQALTFIWVRAGLPRAFLQRRTALHGGQMQGRLVLNGDEQKERARKMGITDFGRKYKVDEMAKGDVVLSATGVTSGSMLSGISQQNGVIWTETLLMRSSTGTIRWIKACHTNRD